LTGLRVDQDRLIDLPPCRPNLPGQVEHPSPQLLGILDPVPRAIIADDEPMRRTNPQFHLDQQEVAAHLRQVLFQFPAFFARALQFNRKATQIRVFSCYRCNPKLPKRYRWFKW